MPLLAAGALAAGAGGAVAAGTTAALGLGASLIQKNQTKKALDGTIAAQKELVNGLQYQPIDIAALTQRAQENAVANATNSLALERALTPALADTRTNLQNSVSEQLKLGGKLPADIANQVTQAARVGSGSSGTLGGASIPLTAQMLGVSALNLLNQRQQNAAGLLAANPLPESGLDPGSIASLEAQQNAAQNQFNLEKAGAQSNLINSQGQAAMSNAGGNNQIIGQLSSLLSGGGSGSILNSGIGALKNIFAGTQNPSNNFQGVGGINSFGGGTLLT